MDLSLVSIDSTTARAHHDAAGMHQGKNVITVLEKAAAEEENSNDSAWLANADRSLTGYERIWGSVATPRSPPRARCARGAPSRTCPRWPQGPADRGRPTGAAVREPGAGR
ncbi:hypothetical protein ACFY0G_16635 [Streptomyces sp. NPDC001552]|uniref:hypothetical protein n=1 Tax=Streptomyces sp. NPDC001552 TaxID=3364587 RepID=UPI0036BDCE41